MSLRVRSIEYFYVRIHDAPEKAYQFLARLAAEEVNLLAFSAVPFGPNHVELTIFPDQTKTFIQLAEKLGYKTTGPQMAISIHLYFNTDQTAYRWTYRVDGRPCRDTTLAAANGSATYGGAVTLQTRT